MCEALPRKESFSLRSGTDEVYNGWRERGPDEAFTVPDFGAWRDDYNAFWDRFMEGNESAVHFHNADPIKNAFRDRIRELANRETELSRLLTTLPQDRQEAYRKICEGESYFTNADFFTLVAGQASTQRLRLLHARENEAAYASTLDHILAGADADRFSLASQSSRGLAVPAIESVGRRIQID